MYILLNSLVLLAHAILKCIIICVQDHTKTGTTGTDCDPEMASHTYSQGRRAHSLNDNLNQGMQKLFVNLGYNDSAHV